MAQERKAIRDGIKAALKTAYAGPIFTSRYMDVRDESEYVNVYFDTGDVTWDGLLSSTTATVIVEYSTTGQVDDDAMDAVADQLNNALATQPIAEDIIQGFLPAGFEYIEQQETEFNTIILRYTVTY